MNDERVAGLRAVDIERTSDAVISFDQRKRISLLQRIAKQSSELASKILPGFRLATGGATPNRYFTLSIVAV
jgi:hypothetical protein